MSANRSVIAAQRRRAGPTNAEPNIPGRGPQPSINSSQMFASQGKQQPQGKQQSQGKQQQQQQQQQLQQGTSDGLSSVSKMTLPQAITLITLRLGSVESKLMNLQENNNLGISNNMQMEGQENMCLIDINVIQSITSRLESLEKRSSVSSNSGPEINLVKQQVDTIKQAVIKSNSVTTNLVKESKDFKMQIDTLKNELLDTKELLEALQNLTMDTSRKLLDISSNIDIDINLDENRLRENLEFTTEDTDNLEYLPADSDTSEIVGANLKELIENEINANM